MVFGVDRYERYVVCFALRDVMCVHGEVFRLVYMPPLMMCERRLTFLLLPGKE